MSNKSAGIALENRFKKALISQGFTVLHCKGSLGFCDLVAIKDRLVLFYSLKRALRKKYINARIRDAIKDIPANVGVPVHIKVWSSEDKDWVSQEINKGPIHLRMQDGYPHVID